MTAVVEQTLLIAGASGVIGAGSVEHFARLGWRVIALSRRRPLVSDDCAFTHVPVDLTDSMACIAALAALPPVTHLIYAAVAEAPGLVAGWQDDALMAQNAAMFENLLHPLATSGQLRHVSLMQGAKAYGAHVHPVTIPLREDTPRDAHANFYWLHEDALSARAAGCGFTFTIWRPQVLIGTAPGAAMNPLAPIAAYAAICRERSLPCGLPGASAGLWEVVDTGLLAEALAWAATSSAAAGQTFNITNGDGFVLRHAWNALASAMGLDGNGDAPPDFASFFAEDVNREAWADLAKRHGLVEPLLPALLGQSHHYLDLLLSPRLAERTPVLISTIKLRRAGFGGCRDSLSALFTQLQKMIALRLMPPMIKRSTPPLH
jgi:nucleoside-diphosphate-sugar epimerase